MQTNHGQFPYLLSYLENGIKLHDILKVIKPRGSNMKIFIRGIDLIMELESRKLIPINTTLFLKMPTCGQYVPKYQVSYLPYLYANNLV